MGARMGHIQEQQWAIYEGKNGPHFEAVMGSYMGHIWEQQWAMHTRIHSHIWGHTWAIWEQQWGMHGRIYGPHGSSNGACMRAYMGHI